MRRPEPILGLVEQAKTDKEKRGELFQRLAPAAARFLAKRGVPEAHVDDVTQNVLLRVEMALDGFEIRLEMQFWQWFWTITRRAWDAFLVTEAQQPLTLENMDHLPSTDEPVKLCEEDELLLKKLARVAATWNEHRRAYLDALINDDKKRGRRQRFGEKWGLTEGQVSDTHRFVIKELARIRDEFEDERAKEEE